MHRFHASSLLLRVVVALAALLTGGRAEAVIPLENVTWGDSVGVPTAAGIARRVQIYYVINCDEERGRNLYAGAQHTVVNSRWSSKYEAIHIVVGNGAVPAHNPSDDEWWCRGIDTTSGGLLRAIAGDADGALILVDATGRIVELMRLNVDDANAKAEKLMKAATPLVDDESQLPSACKPLLKYLTLGDTRYCLKNLGKCGPAGADVQKMILRGTVRLLDADTALLSDPATPPAMKFIALMRATAIAQEAPPNKPLVAVIKGLKTDKDLKHEQDAWTALQGYLAEARHTPIKKIKDKQHEWFPLIDAKFKGTYAADIIDKIKNASHYE